MLTREAGSEQLQTVALVLTPGEPWGQLAPGDIDRRGASVYVDQDGGCPAYLADSERHAQQQTSGAKMSPSGSPCGFELGTTGGIWAYALPADLPPNGVTVFCVIEHGEVPKSVG